MRYAKACERSRSRDMPGRSVPCFSGLGRQRVSCLAVLEFPDLVLRSDNTSGDAVLDLQSDVLVPVVVEALGHANWVFKSEDNGAERQRHDHLVP